VAWCDDDAIQDPQMTAYQSFDERKGTSRSHEKLAAIRMPKNLTGKRVLDLGCNEGFFCLEAKRRGAAEVIGIERNRKHIPLARERAAAEGLDIDFREGNMLDLAEGEFDLVLSLSAIYYLDSPAELLKRIRERLTDTGKLILELGVDKKTDTLGVVRALRSRDERCFPTERLLREVWLDGYSVRLIGPSVAQSGDPIPRVVYHCSRALTNVVLVSGWGRSGKSTLARQIGSHSPVISVDHLLRPKRAPNAVVHDAQKLIDAALDADRSIARMWVTLGEDDSVRSYLAGIIAMAVKQCRFADSIIVEGHFVGSLERDIAEKLGNEFKCWSTTPLAAR
jgi:SAM-dependent methyltransferase